MPLEGFARAILLVFLSALTASALGAEAAPAAENPALEARVNALASELRCLVCQNQTIADSNAALAIDLKNQIREKMQNGETDPQITDYMVARTATSSCTGRRSKQPRSCCGSGLCFWYWPA